jgi:GNAT superfamily N-acetyltransferase
LGRIKEAGITIRRPLPPDRRAVTRWVDAHFGERWAGEVETAFGRMPASLHTAVNASGEICGFACHDVTFRGFFGPAGVPEALRGRGIGTALLLVALRALAEAGFAYAIIGGSGDDEFYRKAVGAVVIPDSDPGPYGTWSNL